MTIFYKLSFLSFSENQYDFYSPFVGQKEQKPSHFCKEPAFGTADKPTLRAYASSLGLQSGSAQKWNFIDV